MKPVYSILLSAMLMGINACQQSKKDSVETSENKVTERTVTKLWETDTVLVGTESVLYHAPLDLAFVSVMGEGDPLAKDGNGAIAQISLDGEILELEWIKDLNGPKGMAIVGDKLYVTDITELLEIDIPSASISNRWEISDAEFLNDVAIATSGVVYFSDMNTNKVHQLMDGAVSILAEGEHLGMPNGLFATKDNLMLSTVGSGDFGALDYSTGQFEVRADSIFTGDGLESDGQGGYLVSRWKGELIHVDGETWEKTSLLFTEDQGINTADIDYVIEKGIVLIPTFFGNTVMAYRLKVK